MARSNNDATDQLQKGLLLPLFPSYPKSAVTNTLIAKGVQVDRITSICTMTYVFRLTYVLSLTTLTSAKL